MKLVTGVGDEPLKIGLGNTTNGVDICRRAVVFSEIATEAARSVSTILYYARH